MHGLPMYCDLLYHCERLQIFWKKNVLKCIHQKVQISSTASGYSILSSFSASSWQPVPSTLNSLLTTFQLSPDHPASACSFDALSSSYAIMFIHHGLTIMFRSTINHIQCSYISHMAPRHSIINIPPMA